jgi:hypothetical protein
LVTAFRVFVSGLSSKRECRNFLQGTGVLTLKGDKDHGSILQVCVEGREGCMERRKAGTLKSGKSGKTVKSKKQAIAIGLSEARSKGKKVPSKKTA